MYPSSTKEKEDATVVHVKNAAREMKDAARDAKDGVSDIAHEAGRKVRHFLHSASDEISHASESVTSEIRSNPVRSSAIALGVGVVLGVLLRR